MAENRERLSVGKTVEGADHGRFRGSALLAQDDEAIARRGGETAQPFEPQRRPAQIHGFPAVQPRADGTPERVEKADFQRAGRIERERPCRQRLVRWAHGAARARRDDSHHALAREFRRRSLQPHRQGAIGGIHFDDTLGDVDSGKRDRPIEGDSGLACLAQRRRRHHARNRGGHGQILFDVELHCLRANRQLAGELRGGLALHDVRQPGGHRQRPRSRFHPGSRTQRQFGEFLILAVEIQDTPVAHRDGGRGGQLIGAQKPQLARGACGFGGDHHRSAQRQRRAAFIQFHEALSQREGSAHGVGFRARQLQHAGSLFGHRAVA